MDREALSYLLFWDWLFPCFSYSSRRCSWGGFGAKLYAMPFFMLSSPLALRRVNVGVNEWVAGSPLLSLLYAREKGGFLCSIVQ